MLHSSGLYSGWNNRRSIDNYSTPHFFSPPLASTQIPSDESCQQINYCSDLLEQNTINRETKRCHRNKEIVSNNEGHYLTTKAEEKQNIGNQQQKTTPLLSTTTKTNVMHKFSKHQVTTRDISFNETINKINLPHTRSSREKLREKLVCCRQILILASNQIGMRQKQKIHRYDL